MEFRNIRADDEAAFKRLAAETQNSSYNFITNYVWGGDDLKIAIEDDCIFLLWNINGSIFMQYPIGKGDTKNAAQKAVEFFNDRLHMPARFTSLCKQNLSELEELFPNSFTVFADRDNFDYIYFSESLAALSGKKLHAKRNHANRFYRTNNYHYRRMTRADAQKCKRLFMLWLSEKTGDDPFLKRSCKATFKLLDSVGSFGLVGGVIDVGGEIVACSVGEKTHTDTALIHAEFANTAFEGSYAAINQQFVLNEWQGVKYINREEDMGDEGLRKAKLSYQPALLLKEYCAFQTEGEKVH